MRVILIFDRAIGYKLSLPIAKSSSEPSKAGTISSPIAQTMMGAVLSKYTRRAIRKGNGEWKHKRFFWIQPSSKTLYWSSESSAVIDGESDAKIKNGMY